MANDLVSAIKTVMGPMARRVMLMIGRAYINLVDDSTPEQSVQLQLLSGELHDRVERYQEYGFTSVPLPGADAIAVAVLGSRDHLVAIATGDRRYRPTDLQPGEVGLYTTEGMVFYAKCTGVANVSGAIPASMAARADRVDTEIARLWTYINAHMHPTGTGPSGTPIPSPPATSATPATASGTILSTAADKAMVE